MLDRFKIILLSLTPLILAGCVFRLPVASEPAPVSNPASPLDSARGEIASVNQELFTVAEQEYDFGLLKQSGGLVSHDFVFTYNGQADLKVKGVPTSCACTSASISRQLFKTGESATVTVTFDPNLHVEPPDKFFKTISVLTEPEIKEAPEFKIWAEIDLDLGPKFYKLQEQHQD